jgi:hypothetical protein
MTKTKFEQGYAERSDVTVEWLHEQGLEAVPCDCEEPDCKGWQMLGSDERAQRECELVAGHLQEGVER